MRQTTSAKDYYGEFSHNTLLVHDAFISYAPSEELMATELSERQFARYQQFSESVREGLGQLFRYTYIRAFICKTFTEQNDKRLFEETLRERMALLDRNSQRDAAHWQQLHLLHHCSVTSDQAELSRAAFL